MLGIVVTMEISMVCMVAKKWVKSYQMALDSTTCMEIFGSGPRTGMAAASHRPVQTRTAVLQVPTASLVVAAGTTTHAVCGRRTVTA